MGRVMTRMGINMVGVIDKYVNKYRESDEMYGDTYGSSNAKYGEKMERVMTCMGKI